MTRPAAEVTVLHCHKLLWWQVHDPDASDPRETLARNPIHFIRSAKTILAYNASFEWRCACELQEQLSHLAEQLREVEERTEDLLPVVREHVYHPGFGDGFGLKSMDT